MGRDLATLAKEPQQFREAGARPGARNRARLVARVASRPLRPPRATRSDRASRSRLFIIINRSGFTADK